MTSALKGDGWMKRAARRSLAGRFLLLFASGFLLIACGKESSTRILVQINADGDVIASAKTVQLVVAARGADEDAFEKVKEFTVPAPVDLSRWPLQHVLEPRGGDATRIYRVTARALDADKKTVISQSGASSGYVSSQTRVLRIHLPGGSCLNTECSLSEACVLGACESIPFVEPTKLPRPGMERDAGSKDAAVDGGARDASNDASLDAGHDAAVDAGKSCPSEECDPPGEECRVGHWDCSGAAPVCIADGVRPTGTLCSLSGCDGGPLCTGICDDQGQCAEAGCGVACTPLDENPCKVYAIECTAEGKTCVETGNQAAGTPCGDGTDNECNKADTCNNSGVCQQNLVAKGTACGDRLSTMCTQPDECDGNGACDPLHLPDNTACDKLHCKTGEKCTAGECGGGSMVTCPTTENSTCRLGTCTEAAEGCTHITKENYCYWSADKTCHTSGQKVSGGCFTCNPTIWIASCVSGG